MRENVINDPVAITPAPNSAARRILGPWAADSTRLALAQTRYGKPKAGLTGRNHKLGKALPRLKQRKMAR